MRILGPAWARTSAGAASTPSAAAPVLSTLRREWAFAVVAGVVVFAVLVMRLSWMRLENGLFMGPPQRLSLR